MNFLVKKNLIFKLLVLLLTLTFDNSFALDYFQKTTIKSNRTGIIRIQYSADNSELKGQDTYMTLPFKDEKIKAAFSSENNKLQSVSINPNKDGKTIVIVEIQFNYIGKINSAQFFSKDIVTYFVSEDSTSFIYNIQKNDQFPENLNPVYTFELPSKEIIRSNGVIKGNSITFGLKSDKVKPGISLFAVFKNSDDVMESNDVSKENKKKESGKEEGSCGLFGIELPLLLGLGYAFNKKLKR